MNANFKLNINNFKLSAQTISIPVSIKYQLVDNEELIQREFVDKEVKKAVNCILDYDKTKFTPIDNSAQKLEIVNITYNIFLIDKLNPQSYKIPTYLEDLGLNNDDILLDNNSFKNSFLFLQFYDDYNPQTRNFLTESQIYNFLYPSLAINNGKIKDVNAIPLKYISSNPKLIEEGFYTAFSVYDYIDKYESNNPTNSIYCLASLFNAKTGKIINLMTTNQAPTIDQLPKKQFMKFDLKRSNNRFVYTIDTSFNNNVTLLTNTDPVLGPKGYKDMEINLYETKVK